MTGSTAPTLLRPFDLLGGWAIRLVASLGRFGSFLGEAFVTMLTPPARSNTPSSRTTTVCQGLARSSSRCTPSRSATNVRGTNSSSEATSTRFPRSHPERSAHEREEESFDQQLTDDAQAPAAEREAHRKFLAPAAAACQ